MSTINDQPVRSLLEAPNFATVSTTNPDGSIHSVVVWVDAEDGHVALNSALGRHWPTNLERDPRATVTVHDERNPYDYVEIRGRAEPRMDGAEEHIDKLAQKYLGRETYPYRRPGERRIKFIIAPDYVRHQAQ
jgi:PPOX class probable F420-dependent enzyme